MRLFLLVAFTAALILLPGEAPAAPDTKEPFIGYLFAAGGQQGTKVRVTAGGQNLRGSRKVYFAGGGGVTAKVLSYGVKNRPLRNEHRRELGRRLRQLVAAKTADLTGRGRRRARPRAKAAGKAAEEPVELPDHPFLRNLNKMSLRELKKVSEFFFDPTQRVQASAQIAETVEIEVTIDKGAPPGDRELRILTNTGLTNPMLFTVGCLKEINEEEINDFEAMALPLLRAPLVVNGQVYVRDIDRFRFLARGGQQLVIAAEARRLVPYMADAVPGWFQATLTLYDAKGNEVEFVDDYRFDPDPVLFFEVPEDGEYELEVRDAIYRGRQDFVYRITIGEQPFVTSMFPLGGRTGVETEAEITGFNLSANRVMLDTVTETGRYRKRAWEQGRGLTNFVPFAVDELPETLEAEPNDDPAGARRINLPLIVNGRIGKPGDVDAFPFSGKAGEEVVVEVYGRRLDSPIDSLVRLTDAGGRVLAWNDDRDDKEMGLCTYPADSYLMAKLPADGIYSVELRDTRGHGSEEHAYRVRISPPRPDFAVIATPSRLNIPTGSTLPFIVHAVRKDGFEGDIAVALSNAPSGFLLSGGRIPAGRDKVRMTISAPKGRTDRPFPLTLVGRAKIGGKTITHDAIAAEDRMQAFLWRHLVSASELLAVLPRSRRGVPVVNRVGTAPVKIPVGGIAKVKFRVPSLSKAGNSTLELYDPPPGVTLRDIGVEEDGVVLVFQADAKAAKVGTADNLIVEVYTMYRPPLRKGQDPKRRPPARKTYVGVIPAIPIEVVK